MNAYKVNEDFFEKIDSEIKAYLLGFFVADGSICMNSRCKNSYCLSVNLTKDDEEIVKLYNDYICPNNHIRYNNNKNGAINRRTTAIIKWTSTKMKEILGEYNMKPRKTYDFEFEFQFDKIPEEFLWDFIRGFFDGDGHISYNCDNHTMTFAFYGTSKPFLEQIGLIFEKEFNVEMKIDSTIKTKLTLYCLRFNSNFKKKEFIKSLYEKFYKNRNFYLKRKKDKFIGYLTFKYRAKQLDFE